MRGAPWPSSGCLKSGSGVALRSATRVSLDRAMDERARRGREIQDRIGRILYEDWDPLGVRGEAPPGEYDSYIAVVYRLLAEGASCERLAQHLAELERDAFGYSEAKAPRHMAAARKLCQLDVRL